uniref:Uncharacterized protein n=1 Tax=Anguilla anguilla TaxID=7936 RepID=A0A0E9QTQ7_ANGAN
MQTHGKTNSGDGSMLTHTNSQVHNSLAGILIKYNNQRMAK